MKSFSEFLFHFCCVRQGREAVAGLRRQVGFPYKKAFADYQRKTARGQDDQTHRPGPRLLPSSVAPAADLPRLCRLGRARVLSRPAVLQHHRPGDRCLCRLLFAAFLQADRQGRGHSEFSVKR
ncbi:hypothetical protein D9M70_594360 [compost metagenome]